MRDWWQRHSLYARFAAVASLSAAVAYLIGSLAPMVASVPAALAAVVSVRPSFHEGLREASVQVLSTIAGGVLAAVLTVTLGPGVVTLTLAVMAAFTLGWLFKVEMATAATIAATIIIVIGTNATSDAVWGRLWGVAVGALIAVLASLYASPGVAAARTLDSAIALASRLAAQLENVGRALQLHGQGSVGVATTDIRRWLESIEQLGRELEPVRREAEVLVQGSAWSPLTRQADAQAVLRQVLLIEVTSETATNMCRDLLITPPALMPASLVSPIGDVFVASARLLRDQLSVAHDAPASRLPAGSVPGSTDLLEAQSRTMREVRSLDDTAPLILGGSVARDAMKIHMLLTQSTPSDDTPPDTVPHRR